jgi:steroid 5-alpha reductase family enzyme
MLSPQALLGNLKHVAAVIGGCNAIGFGITATLETHKITDLVGVGSFGLATISLAHRNGLLTGFKSLSSLNKWRVMLVNVGVMLWSSRLATFLFSRILHTSEDKRLNKFFRKPGEGYLDSSQSFFPIKLFSFWSIQAVWGFVCMLPVTLLNSVNFSHPSPNLSIISGGNPFATLVSFLPIAGIFAGVILEAVADSQKNVYRNDANNKDHWCDKGLWALSRYPNCK